MSSLSSSEEEVELQLVWISVRRRFLLGGGAGTATCADFGGGDASVFASFFFSEEVVERSAYSPSFLQRSSSSP